MRQLLAAAGLTAGGFLQTAAFAHEEPFTYTRGAQIEAVGEWDVTEWSTARIGKETGRYLGMDFQTEIERGLTERLQAALYVNESYHLQSGARGGDETLADRNAAAFSGVSTEFKYQLADPFRKPFGVALYVEPEWSRIESVDGGRHTELGLETILILQKNFRGGRLITALNLTAEPEYETSPSDAAWHASLLLRATAGASLRVAGSWRLGAETRWNGHLAGANPGRLDWTTFSLGPNVSYMGDRWFASLTLLPQLRGWPNIRSAAGLHLLESERLAVQLKAGVEF